MMQEKIRQYISEAFSQTVNNKQSRELKEELLANLLEKYQDGLSSGKSETESYNQAIASIGDIDELIAAVERHSPLATPSANQQKTNAIITSCAVMLYILSPAALITSTLFFERPEIGLLLLFLMVAAATGMLIYNSLNKPRYYKTDETLVEEFKEWKSGTDHKKSAYSSLSSAFWSLVTVIYLVYSFSTMGWAYSWIIFIIGGAIENIVKGFFLLSRKD